MPKKFVVAFGNVADGFAFYGPFDDHDDATAWAERQTGDSPWWIVPVEAPA